MTKWCTPGQHVLCVNEYVISVLFCPRSIHGPRVGCIMSHCSCLSVARILFCSNKQPGPRLTLSNHGILGAKCISLSCSTLPSIKSKHGEMCQYCFLRTQATLRMQEFLEWISTTEVQGNRTNFADNSRSYLRNITKSLVALGCSGVATGRGGGMGERVPHLSQGRQLWDSSRSDEKLVRLGVPLSVFG